MSLLRTETFVPLTTVPADSGSRPLSVTVIRESEQARPFKSLEPLAAGAAGAVAAHPEKICEPRVSIQREGDRIVGLRIQCTCGQIMDLACVYDSNVKPG